MTITLNGDSGISTPMYGGSISSNPVTPSVSMKNRIINGSMVIDQRNAGASVTITNSAPYTLDRWCAYSNPSSKFSVQQNAGSVTLPAGFTNYLGCTSLSAYSIGSTDRNMVFQYIEGYNIADLAWGTANAKTVTLSFQVYSSLTGTFGGSLTNSAGNRSYPFSYTISSANTWTTISVTITGDTSGTWLTTNGVGIAVYFGLGVGSTYSASAGSWQAGQYHSATGATSVVGTNGATFYITGVQLEVGSTASSFDYRPYGTELALCQRYYYLHASGDAKPIGMGSYYTSSRIETVFNLPVTMRSAPTLSVVTNTNAYDIYRNGTDDPFNSFTLDGASTTSVALYNSTEISGTAGQAGYCYTNNANAFIAFQSEL